MKKKSIIAFALGLKKTESRRVVTCSRLYGVRKFAL